MLFEEASLGVILEALTTGPLAVNTYLLGDSDAGRALVVDPGGAANAIVGLLDRRGLQLQAILATHAHIDHVAGAEELRRRSGARLRMHPAAQASLATLPAQAMWFGLEPIEVPVVDESLRPGEEVQIGGLRLTVRDTPGHAPGHVTLVSEPLPLGDRAVIVALCGDVLFQGSIGRTDLPGGDYEQLMHSIEREILTLPDEALILPGHGPASTVGQERHGNPFLVEWLVRKGRQPVQPTAAR